MFNNDPLKYPYSSKRNCVYGSQGMVATSQPLAAEAGIEILKKGGNAIDAAIATAACLTVVEPTSNGIGSDAFALVWFKNKLHGLNASGYAPENISIDKLKALGYDEIPRFGFIPVTIPGTPAGWVELSQKFGNLSLEEVLKPAINYARNGYPISPTLGYHWHHAFNIYKKHLKGIEFKPWFDTFTINGKPPKIGEIWKSEGHAKTLELIAKTKGKAFYNGSLTDQIIEYSNNYNGFLSYDDFKSFKPIWVDPISTTYKGYTVSEIPPNGQGIIALMALNMLNSDYFSKLESDETVHKQIEAIKYAFSDGHKYITDATKMTINYHDLISESYGQARRDQFTDHASIPMPGNPSKGGTVYLATADKEGNMVSYIQSNYMGFGSGIVIPNTGIALQNRGHNFSFDKTHDNALAPRKKPYHTIIPGFLTKGSEPVGPFGVMGGFMQPQGHLQVLMNTIDFRLNPQAALDAPRFQWLKDKKVAVEPSMDASVVKGLIQRGHEVIIEPNLSSFGRGQIIWRNPLTGVYVGGTESRTDGHIAVW